MLDFIVPQTRPCFHFESRHSPSDFRRQLEEVVLYGLIVHQQRVMLVANCNLSPENIVIVFPKDRARTGVHSYQGAPGMLTGFQ